MCEKVKSGGASLDSEFYGLAGSTEAVSIYQEILDHAAGDVACTDVTEDPNEPIDRHVRRHSSKNIQPRYVFGSSFSGPYEGLWEVADHTVLSVRGFLSLNRLHYLAHPVAVGDLGLLAPIPSHPRQEGGGVLCVTDANESGYFRDIVGENPAVHTVLSLEVGLQRIIEAIASHSFVFSTEVVALAIADKLGRPNAWVRGGSTESVEEKRFSVMDYFSAVNRDTRVGYSRLPRTHRGVLKATSCADAAVVEKRVQALRGAVEALQEDLERFRVTSLLDEPIVVGSHPVKLELERSTNELLAEFATQFAGTKTSKQFLVSFDVQAPDGLLSDGQPIEGLFHSSNSDIGYFRYLDTQPGDSKVSFSLKLPEGVHCNALKIVKWNQNAPDLKVKQITARCTSVDKN